jgi:glutamate carboxypeptidase
MAIRRNVKVASQGEFYQTGMKGMMAAMTSSIDDPTYSIQKSTQMLEELRRWVEVESPSEDPRAVDRLTDYVESQLRPLNVRIERVRGIDGAGDCLIARTEGHGQSVLVCAHLDTVWKKGTLATVMPFRVIGDRAYGPGIHDMKAGAVMAVDAFRRIAIDGIVTNRPITLLFTPDEETGSVSSRWLIEQEALKAAVVLIPEPANGQDGACCTGRKGMGIFQVHIRGVAAHAGVAWDQGRSAVSALAEVIQAIDALVDSGSGITTNIAPIWGGSQPNIVACDAGCKVDVRVKTAVDGRRMEQAILSMAGQRSGIEIEISGGMNRPPMEETDKILELYEVAREAATRAGFDLPKCLRGGVSDGNFTAALGIPTLDGLGCTGGGAHTPDEHIIWVDLAPRSAVLFDLMCSL